MLVALIAAVLTISGHGESPTLLVTQDAVVVTVDSHGQRGPAHWMSRKQNIRSVFVHDVDGAKYGRLNLSSMIFEPRMLVRFPESLGPFLLRRADDRHPLLLNMKFWEIEMHGDEWLNLSAVVAVRPVAVDTNVLLVGQYLEDAQLFVPLPDAVLENPDAVPGLRQRIETATQASQVWFSRDLTIVFGPGTQTSLRRLLRAWPHAPLGGPLRYPRE